MKSDTIVRIQTYGRGALALIFMLLLGVLAAEPLRAAGLGPQTPAFTPYPLYGDSTNTPGGSAGSFFTTTSSAIAGWSFTEKGTNGTGLRGVALANGSASTGVEGQGWSIGTRGEGYSDTSIGVYGQTIGTHGIGVKGEGSASGYGVWGLGKNGGMGVYATTTLTGTAVGAAGGVVGVWANAAAANSVGVIGSSTGISGTGVIGTTDATNPTAAGVVGRADHVTGVSGKSKDSNGVYGYSTNAVAIYGTSDTTDGVAGVGGTGSGSAGVRGTGTFGYGIYGISSDNYGVVGYTTSAGVNDAGVRAIGTNNYGIYATAKGGIGGYITTVTGTTALRAKNPITSSGYFAIIADGNVQINGNYVATGTKSASVATTQGARLMYAEEATTNIFSDRGTATLKDGRVVITIDPLYAQTVSLGAGYQVFLTARSFDSKGLVVGNLTATSFEVREINSGKGSYQFDWRIEAARKGYEKERMAPAPRVPVDPAPQDPYDQHDPATR